MNLHFNQIITLSNGHIQHLALVTVLKRLNFFIYLSQLGSSLALRYILVPDMFGVDKIADLMGLDMFFSGIAAFIGLPIAGQWYIFLLNVQNLYVMV